MMLNILPPPALQGDEQAQLSQVYRYLFRLSEQLNATSAALDSQAGKASEAVMKAAGIEPAEAAKADSQYSALVSLVIKTANVVQAQMDKIVTRLHADYIAKSEWGEYEESIQREIEDTAKGTIETYIYDAKLESLSPDEVREFDTQVKGSIARGIIGFDDDYIPIIGIAIAQDIRKRIEYINGMPYEVIDTAKTKNMTVYTADKLSFWIDGVETAYLSNSELVVTRIKVSDYIQLGDWEIAVNAKDGMTIQKRIGSALDLSGNTTLTVDQLNVLAAYIDLSANETIKLTADKVNAVADQINLEGNEYVRLIAKEAKAANSSFYQPEQPTGNDLVRPGDIWTIPATGQTYYAEDASNLKLQFALDEDGNLYYEIGDTDSDIELEVQGFDLYSNGVYFTGFEDGTQGITYIWRLVQDQDLTRLKESALSKEDFKHYVDVKRDGLHVGLLDKENMGYTRITYNSFDVVNSEGRIAASLGDSRQDLGNMTIYTTAEGHTVFIPRWL